MAASVHVSGLNETLRALNFVNKAAAKVVKAELALAVRPIADDFRERVGVYQGASTATIGPRVSTRSVFVTQRARKRTGLRSDFGSLQMRHLLSAAASHEDEIRGEVEDALGRLISTQGLG